MNMKRLARIALGCFITLGITIFLLQHSSQILMRKDADKKLGPFFEQKEDFDVLFMGTSHMMYGISPMELWHDYGIVSYNFGSQGSLLPSSYWIMKNAFDYTTPQLVVIDCYLLSHPEKVDIALHKSLDAFPISRTKIQAVLDLLKDTNTDLTYSEFLWNFSIYHQRWNDLEITDFEQAYTKGKGGEALLGIQAGKEMEKISSDSKMENDTIAIEYLEKMIGECKNRGIDVLLTYIPFPASGNCQQEANTIYDIAEEYGINYINFLNLDIVDYKTDCYDGDHLNISGMKKVSEYLGKYIVENYNIANQKENEAYDGWYEDYEDYKNELDTKLRECESLDYYMLCLYDKNYYITIETKDGSVWNNDYYANLLENLGFSRGAMTKDTDFLVVQDVGEAAVCFEDFHHAGSNAVTGIGEFSYSALDNGDYGICLNNKEIYTVTPVQDENMDIRITVFDKNSMEIIDQSSFSTINGAIGLYRKIYEE